MQFLNERQLEELPTARLLALYRKRSKEMRSAYAWITDYGNYPEGIKDKEDDPYFQKTLQLNKYCDQIKAILDNREHVERR